MLHHFTDPTFDACLTGSDSDLRVKPSTVLSSQFLMQCDAFNHTYARNHLRRAVLLLFKAYTSSSPIAATCEQASRQTGKRMLDGGKASGFCSRDTASTKR